MLIVGELINASRKAMGPAIEARQAEVISKTAMDQMDAGADYIDVNAGIFMGQEADYLSWLVTTVQEHSPEARCCIDSPDPAALEAGLAVHKGAAMVNSYPTQIESCHSQADPYDLSRFRQPHATPPFADRGRTDQSGNRLPLESVRSVSFRRSSP